jgi:hypothetical protein
MTVDDIPTDVVREAFERSGLTLSQVAKNLGWVTQVPDVGRVSVMIGRKPDPKYKRPHATMRYDSALKLCEAMGYDPVDLGL